MDAATQQVGEVRAQLLRLVLDGITAGDYLCWVRDPEPQALVKLGHNLQSISASADPLRDRIELELHWDREPPDPCSAAVAAGFLLTPEVVDVLADEHKPAQLATQIVALTEEKLP
jgi:hypothetical protein